MVRQIRLIRLTRPNIINFRAEEGAYGKTHDIICSRFFMDIVANSSTPKRGKTVDFLMLLFLKHYYTDVHCLLTDFTSLVITCF